jgi:hypothetical protein
MRHHVGGHVELLAGTHAGCYRLHRHRKQLQSVDRLTGVQTTQCGFLLITCQCVSSSAEEPEYTAQQQQQVTAALVARPACPSTSPYAAFDTTNGLMR